MNKKRHRAQSAVANSFVNADRTKIDDSLQSWSGPRRRRAANALARHSRQAALVRFLAQGVEATSAEQIAEDAGVSLLKRRTKNEPRLKVPSCHGRRMVHNTQI